MFSALEVFISQNKNKTKKRQNFPQTKTHPCYTPIMLNISA